MTMELKETIILNGLIDNVSTHDENDYTIGIKDEKEIKTFGGKVIKTANEGFPFSKAMYEKLDWGNYKTSMRFFISDSKINPDTVEEEYIQQLMGYPDCTYHHSYSDYTGYLWTTERFIVGGHDFLKTLNNNEGKYIHLEIELYKEKED